MINISRQADNKWAFFEKRIQQEIDYKYTSIEVKSHLELARYIVKRGINSKLSMRYAFLL